MRTAILIVAAWAATACGDDAATAPAPDAGESFTVPEPSFRLGPRSTLGGFFGQPPITGTIRLPTELATELAGASWQISSRAEAAEATLEARRVDGGDTLIDFTVTVSTSFQRPEDRELFVAASGDV